MAAHADQVAAAGGQSIVIGPGSAEEAARLALRLHVGVPVYADPSGAALDALGCTRLLGPLRRSGTVVVDAGGVVRLAVQVANPSAALPWGQVRAALAGGSA